MRERAGDVALRSAGRDPCPRCDGPLDPLEGDRPLSFSLEAQSAMTDTKAVADRDRATLQAMRLAGAALALAVATPALMVVSRGIAPVTLAVATLLVILAAYQAGRSREATGQVLAFLASPAGLLAALAGVYLVLSATWSLTPIRGGEMALQTIAAGLVAVVALSHAAAASEILRLRPLLLASGLAAAALLSLVELHGGAPLRDMLGGNLDPSRLNRTAVAIALLLPLALALLLVDGRRFSAGALAALVALAVFSSISESAKLALLVAACTALLYRVVPRLVLPLLAAGVLASLLAAPFLVSIANDFVPAAVHDAVGYSTLGIRGEIWTRYAWLIPDRPFFGHGVEGGHMTADVLAGHLTEHDRMLLNFGHPHNFALQVWFDLGLVGVLLTAAVLAVFFRALSTLREPLRGVALATTAAVWSVAYVSHGAWQAWWWCLLASVALLFLAAQKEWVHGAHMERHGVRTC